jgi:UDP-N-acetylglucosamine 4-epimerase
MYANPFHTQSLENTSFLVTGGAGFIGSHLVEYLLLHNAKRVVVLDNLATGSIDNVKLFEENPRYTFIKGDIRSLEDCQKACEGIQVVLHQAALGSVPRSITDPITTNDVNIGGFLNMLVASRDAGVKRFVYAASSSTYGDSQELPKVEHKIGKPLSPYAITKYVNELYADVFGRLYGVETIGLRYFNVFGPRQSPNGAYAAVIPLFAQGILSNTPPTINGQGEQTRDFTFVANAVQANILASTTDNAEAVGEVFNVACGDRTSLNQLYFLLQELGNSTLQPNYGPPRTGDIQDSLADISKIEKLLNYKPTIRIKEGLQLTLAWFGK